MTGSIWKLYVAAGDNVTQGQVLAVLESMKMEIELPAPHAGLVNSVQRTEGQTIKAGQAVVLLSEN